MAGVNIIGICGRKFHGKDTIADYLVKNYGFTKVSLADPLKKGVQEIFGLTDDQLWGNQKEIVDSYWNISPREILQVVGTECFRNTFGKVFPHIGENFWTISLNRRIKKLIETGIKNIVIADIRFPNEQELIKQYNGILINVKRELPQSNNCHINPILFTLLGDDKHISENLELHPDFIIKNRTFEQLYKDIDFLIFPYDI